MRRVCCAWALVLATAPPGAFALAADDACAVTHEPRELLTMPIEAIEGRPLVAGTAYRAATVGIVRQNIFNTRDPNEDNALFRVANLWHVATREQTIRTLLLFSEGDPVTPARIAESERLLRAKRFLYDARIIANRRCGDHLDLVVVTRDVWSLVPNLGVTRTGGEQEIEVGLSEVNIAGQGAEFNIQVFDNLDRRGVSIRYSDANLDSSRVGLRLRFDDTDDGRNARVRVGQPFYAFEVRRAWEVMLRNSDTRRSLYEAGRQVASFRLERRLARLSTGWSGGLVDGFANRLSIGFSFDEWRFREPSGAPLELRDRAFSYPWISFERVEDEYSKMRNLSRIGTTEDVFLGLRVNASLGYSARSGGYYIGTVAVRDGLRVGTGDDVLRYGLNASGYWSREADQAENVVARAWFQYRRRQAPRLALHVDSEVVVSEALTADRQLLTGGDTGLRGYPNRFQTGSRRFRITFEERYYSSLYLLRILRVAAAAFVDVGRAWDSRRDNDLLANVGVGLRLESTRTDRSSVYHLDVAVPLVDGSDVRDVEVTLTSKRGL